MQQKSGGVNIEKVQEKTALNTGHFLPPPARAKIMSAMVLLSGGRIIKNKTSPFASYANAEAHNFIFSISFLCFKLEDLIDCFFALF